jgi:hypothetical protein
LESEGLEWEGLKDVKGAFMMKYSCFGNMIIKSAMNIYTVTVGTCTIGGFNVSTLMGIIRRMIDIGKKNNF